MQLHGQCAAFVFEVTLHHLRHLATGGQLAGGQFGAAAFSDVVKSDHAADDRARGRVDQRRGPARHLHRAAHARASQSLARFDGLTVAQALQVVVDFLTQMVGCQYAAIEAAEHLRRIAKQAFGRWVPQFDPAVETGQQDGVRRLAHRQGQTLVFADAAVERLGHAVESIAERSKLWRMNALNSGVEVPGSHALEPMRQGADRPKRSANDPVDQQVCGHEKGQGQPSQLRDIVPRVKDGAAWVGCNHQL